MTVHRVAANRNAVSRDPAAHDVKGFKGMREITQPPPTYHRHSHG